MATTTKKKLDELYELIEGIETAMMTTRRADGRLVTRPMATQDHGPVGDLWFVTNIETDKTKEIQQDPNVNLGYYNDDSKEWVSISGRAQISQDRAMIRKLHKPDWTMWFEDEGGQRNGGPDDPRLALIIVDAEVVHYMKSKYTRPRVLFELVKGMLTGKAPDLGREEHLSPEELT